MRTNSTLVNEKRLSQSKSVESIQVKKARKHGLLFDVISSIVVILAGFAVYKATGLYESVASVMGKVALGAVISLAYLVVFRRAYYAK